MRFVIAVGLKSNRMSFEPSYRILDTATGNCNWIGRKELVDTLEKDPNYVTNLKLNTYKQLVGVGFNIEKLKSYRRTGFMSETYDRKSRLALYMYRHDAKFRSLNDKMYIADPAGRIERVAVGELKSYLSRYNLINDIETCEKWKMQYPKCPAIMYIE